MKLDALSLELNKQSGVEALSVRNGPGNSLFDYDCFRTLTRQYVGMEDDANRLCELLSEAEEAADLGDFAAKSRFLSSYSDEVSARPRQFVTCKGMMVLIMLARIV
jgi:hypothetical protein